MGNYEFIENCGNGTYLVKLLKEYYEREAVFAAADVFKERYYVKIDSFGDYVGIFFSAKNMQDDPSVGLRDFCNVVLDQQVYRDLNKQYGHLRDIIYEYAFSPISMQGNK